MGEREKDGRRVVRDIPPPWQGCPGNRDCVHVFGKRVDNTVGKAKLIKRIKMRCVQILFRTVARTLTTHQLTGGEETVMKPIGIYGDD